MSEIIESGSLGQTSDPSTVRGQEDSVMNGQEHQTNGRVENLPRCKMWSYDGEVLVVAETNNRAEELLRAVGYNAEVRGMPCTGDWWHPYADEEGIYIRKLDENGVAVFYRPMQTKESSEIANRHFSRYMAMPTEELTALAGEEVVIAEESSTGTPYKVIVMVKIGKRPGLDQEMLTLSLTVTDDLTWMSGVNMSLFRDLPKPEPVDWTRDGF